jgi:DNA-directed RNA polymerase specialized sigma54-like protein
MEEIQQSADVPMENVESALCLIQSFDPPGVAARPSPNACSFGLRP